jgi:tetratricopeptide (TPR) repeat protein/SAM-dependent methyltransferase
MSTSPEDNFREAIASFRTGKFDDAERRLKKVLRQQPRNVGALNVLGAILMHLQRYAEAERPLKSALELDASSDATFYNYGLVLKALKRPAEALERFTQALAINPSIADSWNNCGTALNDLRRYDEAIVRFDKAIGLRKDYAEAIYNRGNSLAGLRRTDEASAAYDQALALKPDFAEAWLGRGRLLSDLRRSEDAQAAYRQALALKPNLPEALSALARLLLNEGNVGEALALAHRSLTLSDAPETKSLIAACLRSPQLQPGIGDLRDLLVRAMSENWGRASAMAPTGARFVTLNATIRSGMGAAARADFRTQPAAELVRSIGLANFADDRLLRTLLETAPVFGSELEAFVTALRFVLLSVARTAPAAPVAAPVLALYAAVARQCFINNYVFAQSEAEAAQAMALRDVLAAKLASGTAVPALPLLAVAAYAPLHTLPGAEALLRRRWPDIVDAVLAQQIRAPLEEQRLRAAMPALTEIGDDVSSEVRDQYEENPYPQWLEMEPLPESLTPDELMREMFPDSTLAETGKSGRTDVLVAGCGTGRQAIYSSKRFRDAQVLAIDLSLTSLGYAERQTRRLGLDNIRYAQADITKLSSIGESFDVIESSGVLHHLADPFVGWRELLQLLRPGGIMLLGFYSELARRDVVAAREFIAERGYRATTDDIRSCRQEMIGAADGTALKNMTLTSDFFSLSECRDLLFHVQEHRLTLPAIAAFLADNGLEFLGFDIDASIKQRYARQFPADRAMTNLTQWHQYETENSHTFFEMYQFWIQKK